MGFAPERVGYFLARMERYGFFIIIALLYLGILDFLIAFFSVVSSCLLLKLLLG